VYDVFNLDTGNFCTFLSEEEAKRYSFPDGKVGTMLLHWEKGKGEISFERDGKWEKASFLLLTKCLGAWMQKNKRALTPLSKVPNSEKRDEPIDTQAQSSDG